MADNPFLAGLKKIAGIRPVGGDGAYAQEYNPQSEIAKTAFGEGALKDFAADNYVPIGEDGTKVLKDTRKLLNGHGHPDTVVFEETDNSLLDMGDGRTAKVQAISGKTGDGKKFIIIPSDAVTALEKDRSLRGPVMTHEVGHQVMGLNAPPVGAPEEVQKEVFHGNEYSADRFAACLEGEEKLVKGLRALVQINSMDPNEEGLTHPSINARIAKVQSYQGHACDAVPGMAKKSKPRLPGS